MIRKCTDADFETIYEIVNDAARAYKGVIPADRWHEPYMSRGELAHEITDGVVFWGVEMEETLAGVMGIQDKGEVHLIRHAYVRTKWHQQGIGSRLLAVLESLTAKPILMGTWAAATWAVAFYAKNGYTLVGEDEKNRLLKTYWSIPARQVQTSVVLANPTWVKQQRPE